MSIFGKDVFGNSLFLKRAVIRLLGLVSHQRYRKFNNLQIEGSQILRDIPSNNVLIISNHQTYFADVAAMFHVFNASLSGRDDSIRSIGYLHKPKMNLYFVAAGETMRAGWLPKLMAYAGAIPIERTWRADGKDVKRNVKFSDITNIGMALADGWVITFPQGTTKPFNPIRKGTAHIIKKFKPIVVPIVIDGFRRAFDKKGLMIKKRDVLQSMVIKEPLDIDYDNESVDEIVTKIEFAIEQHSSFLKVIPVAEYKKQEAALNKKRNFWDMY